MERLDNEVLVISGLVIVILVYLFDGVMCEIWFGLALQEKIISGLIDEIFLFRAIHISHVILEWYAFEKGSGAALLELH